MTGPEISAVADWLTRTFNPDSVIDVGPTRRTLPEVLKLMGVRAIGIGPELSGDPPPSHVDLAVHLNLPAGAGDEEARTTMYQLCGMAHRILISVTSGESNRARWSRLAAERGFYLNTDTDAAAVVPEAMVFERVTAGIPARDVPVASDAVQNEIERLRRTLAESEALEVELTAHLLDVERSLAYKASRWLERRFRNSRRGRPSVHGSASLPRRVAEVLLDEGPRMAAAKVWFRLQRSLRARLQAKTGVRAGVHSVRSEPVIAVLVRGRASYATGLHKTIASIRGQGYWRWAIHVLPGAVPASGWRQALAMVDGADRDARIAPAPLSGHAADVLPAISGDYLAFVSAGDQLSDDALEAVVTTINEQPGVDLIYSDQTVPATGDSPPTPFFKPGWSPDLLLSINYVGKFCVVRRGLLDEAGASARIGEANYHAFVLQLAEHAQRIAHIPRLLYHHAEGADVVEVAGDATITEALARRGYRASVETWRDPRSGRRYPIPRYALKAKALVSIIIPTRDRVHLLRQCIQSIEAKTQYEPYELLVIDNGSTEPATLAYLERLAGQARVLRWPEPFNYAAINNFGARHARGERLLFLNDDVRVIRQDWLTGMAEHAQRREVGAVGAKLLYPDGSIQHGGVVLGVGGAAAHAFRYCRGDAEGYFGLPHLVRNCSAVTGACMMVRREVFDEVSGFDEGFRIAFNDVDLCLRIRERGYLVVVTPVALLYHFEGASRGRRNPPDDERRFRDRWGELIERGDPYYNPNLSRTREDWSPAT